MKLVPSHVCTVCKRLLDKHADRALCCPGCDCGSYERGQETLAAGRRALVMLEKLSTALRCDLCDDVASFSRWDGNRIEYMCGTHRALDEMPGWVSLKR